MGMFAGIFETFAERQFARDESGRLVFLPRGARRTGYYLAGSEESKFKSLAKVYGAAAMLINLTGSTASIAFTQALTFDERSAPLASKLRFGLVVYAISAILLYVGPALILGSVYRGVVAGLCSPLTAVDPASLRLTHPPSKQHRNRVIVIFAATLILLLGVLAMIAYRR
jgi:hypothetical protein